MRRTSARETGANRRRLAKYIHPGRAQTAQLVMGVTSSRPATCGIRCRAHALRRTEVYLYFDCRSDAVVIHLMGEPGETRHLVVRNEEVVLSPPWSIHSGCGTASYCVLLGHGWGESGLSDMQAVDMRELK